MAAPEYVPRKAVPGAKVYESPPWEHQPWTGHGVADLVDGQPRGPGYGNPGPDQGYALVLAERFRGQLALRPGESEDDALGGCVFVALRRASLFGRAPVIHDLRVALTVWGFLDPDADDELVAFRRPLFEGVAHAHHYLAQRTIVDQVPEATLRMTPHQVESAYRDDWRSALGASI